MYFSQWINHQITGHWAIHETLKLLLCLYQQSNIMIGKKSKPLLYFYAKCSLWLFRNMNIKKYVLFLTSIAIALPEMQTSWRFFGNYVNYSWHNSDLSVNQIMWSSHFQIKCAKNKYNILKLLTMEFNGPRSMCQ